MDLPALTLLRIFHYALLLPNQVDNQVLKKTLRSTISGNDYTLLKPNTKLKERHALCDVKCRGMERGMRQKSRRGKSGEDVKIMIELENGPMYVLLIVHEIALDIDQEFESHFKISSLLVKCAFHCFVFALMDLSPRKMEKAREAIDFLSSLPGKSGGSTPGTSTDSGDKIEGNHAHLTNCCCLAD